MTTTSRTPHHPAGAIDASWFDADFAGTSATWRLMYADEAADSDDLACDEIVVADVLAGGWPRHAAALLAAAWWVAEALWRNGVAASVLSVEHLRRARQIGLAVFATPPVTAPPGPFAAAWLASQLFDAPHRTTIQLQLPRPLAFDREAVAASMPRFSPAQSRKLVGYARSAMGVP